MRFHSHYPLLQLWRSTRGQSLIRADKLSAARFEPTIENAAGGGALLDLVFSDGEQIAVVPYIRVQPVFLLQHERTPLVWPSAARSAGRDVLLEIERLLLPWLQSLTLARQQNEEAVRIFGDASASSLFARARDDGFIGAARYAEIMPALAPYVYAARLCGGQTVAVADPYGANGAAMLAARAATVFADLGSTERNTFANAWFGTAMFGDTPVSAADVVIAGHDDLRCDARVARITLDSEETGAHHVRIAAAVPAEVLVSFDPDDAPVVRTISVRSNVLHDLRRPIDPPAAAPAGGSSGRILMLLREGFERAPDADVDEARSLASRLRAEGFTVEFASPATVGGERAADLVHAIGLCAGMDKALEPIRRAGVPIVANAGFGSAGDEAAWGPEIMSAAWGRAYDDAMLAEYLDLIALRKLAMEKPGEGSPVAAALRHVDVVLAAAPAQETQLREVYGFERDIVRYAPAPAFEGCAAADVTALVGNAPFAFVHAPVQWRMNLPLLACAAAEQGIPLVVAGPVVDVAALRAASRLAPELVMHLAAPDDAQVEALYRSARVYADVSWAPQGLSRIARAAASGCRLLLSRTLYAAELSPGACGVDAASLESVAAGLAQAWSLPQPAPVQGGGDLFTAAIFAYSKALAARQPA
ncbi:MAG TPA: hypothetical protein VJP85_14885 [Candidatus Baltobacteraceae bacterium]|nr:hypothetical protein [Candidatus Baltobacteraceae bacterium]